MALSLLRVASSQLKQKECPLDPGNVFSGRTNTSSLESLVHRCYTIINYGNRRERTCCEPLDMVDHFIGSELQLFRLLAPRLYQVPPSFPLIYRLGGLALDLLDVRLNLVEKKRQALKE